MKVDFVLETHPGEESDAEGEVEESLVGDRKDDEDRGESEEHDEQAVEVVVLGLQSV